MSQKDTEAAHVEHPEHEAVLTGAIALASLFSSCVEAFGLIHPSHKWEREEQLLFTRLGIQQARLLIWGSSLGVSSPPASVTDRAIPKHPSSAYPDLAEPTFFDARDPRLDDPQTRTTIEQALSAIVDRSSQHTREEMMAKFGLKPPKRFTATFEQALDINRLEFFRERYELLREVAESYAQINTRRTNSIIHTSWTIADTTKFGSYIKLIQEKVDFLIDLMGVKDKVDRGMRMDIRMFGWHIIPDKLRLANDISKLRLMKDVCEQDYPEYLVAIQQALDNISRETREAAMPAIRINRAAPDIAPTNGGAAPEHHKQRPGLLKIFRSFGKKDKSNGARRASTDSTAQDDPIRSLSDAGPTNYGDDDEAPLGRVRSKSVGAWIDAPGDMSEDIMTRLEKMGPTSEVKETSLQTLEEGKEMKGVPVESVAIPPADPTRIQRHDQYHGIARVDTKDMRQPGGDFGSGSL